MWFGPVEHDASALVGSFLDGLGRVASWGHCFQFTMMYRKSQVYESIQGTEYEMDCRGYPTGRYEYQWDIVAIDKGPCLFESDPSEFYQGCM